MTQTFTELPVCPAHAGVDLHQTPVRDHTAARVTHCILAPGRGSDVNTTDWRMTVKLQFVKEKQEASQLWAPIAGKRQLEGSPVYRAPNSGARDSTPAPVYLSQSFWPFDLDASSSAFFSISIFHTCIKVIVPGCVSVCLSFFFLVTLAD